jgi:hypothetical protein
MIDLFALFQGYLEGVDDLNFTTILSPEKGTKD